MRPSWDVFLPLAAVAFNETATMPQHGPHGASGEHAMSWISALDSRSTHLSRQAQRQFQSCEPEGLLQQTERWPRR